MDAAEKKPLSLPTKDTIVEVPVSSGSILQNGEEEYYYFLFNCRKEWGNVHLYCTPLLTVRTYFHYYLFNPPFQKKSEGTSLYVYTWYRCSLKQYNAAPGRASLANLKSLVLDRIILLLPLWMNWFLSVTSTNHLLDFDEEK